MINKTKKAFKVFFGTFLFLLVASNCSDPDELITELDVPREFSPVNVRAIIRTQTTVELTWNQDERVENYVVEVSTDPEFGTIVETVNVSSSELPVQILLAAETIYYVRVKAVSSRGLEDSKFSTTVIAETLTEQIFLPIQPGDITSDQALLRWLAGSRVTSIVLNRESSNPITREITPDEAAEGIAVITGLTGETDYVATLLNGNNIRGILPFTTEVSRDSGDVVTPMDDLFQRVADAQPGDILLLESGDYTDQIGTIDIDKPLTIRGLQSFDKPLLKVSFSILTGATDVNLIDLDLSGESDSISDVVRFSGADSFNSFVMDGCNVHDYIRSFIAGNQTGAILQSLQVNNCVVTNVLTVGGDFIDFRNSDVLNTAVTNSTFNNCAPGRDFFRIDASGDSNGTGVDINVLLANCTLYAISDTDDRVLYVRFETNSIVVRDNIFAQTSAYYSNQSRTDPSTIFENNNYFEAPGFFDSGNTVFDATTTFFTLDPGFANVDAGNFTVSNQTLIDNRIGDPRWLP